MDLAGSDILCSQWTLYTNKKDKIEGFISAYKCFLKNFYSYYDIVSIILKIPRVNLLVFMPFNRYKNQLLKYSIRNRPYKISYSIKDNIYLECMESKLENLLFSWVSLFLMF